MVRASTIFIAICMTLIAAALGVVLFVAAGLNALQSTAVGLAALILMGLAHVVSMRLRETGDTAEQIAGLSRGVGDLARQVSEYGRRLTALEHRVVAAEVKGQQRTDALFGEINELGSLVRQLALSVAAHEDALGGDASAATMRKVAPPAEPALVDPAPAPDVPVTPTTIAHDAEIRRRIAHAVASEQFDIYLQPLVTLPQRKVRFYEAMARLRNEDGEVLAAERFLPIADAMGLMGEIDRLVLSRCMQVVQRLIERKQDIGLFCNLSAATLTDSAAFDACRDILEAHRGQADTLVLEFRHDALRALGPVERKNLGTLAGYGYRFSIDHVSDLRIKPRDLADLGVRFIKVPAPLLLDQQQASSDIHPADLADLLGRFGIALVAERIEGESAVVDLLDYEIRFGQGHLFAPPRPLRPDAAAPRAAHDEPVTAAPAGPPRDAATEPAPPPARTGGLAALARRAARPLRS